MTSNDYSALGAWAYAKHKLSPTDVQCALVVAYGADYDTNTISLQDAQRACASYAAMVDYLADTR